MYDLSWLDGMHRLNVPMAYHVTREPEASYIFGVDLTLVLLGVLLIPLAWLLYKIWYKKR